jgi:DNA-binding CsgD family transcriptional regulator
MFEDLTARELEVLQQMAKGLANKEIGDVLKISEHTVKGHLKNILGKLLVADRTEAVTKACSAELFSCRKPITDPATIPRRPTAFVLLRDSRRASRYPRRRS